MEKSVEPSMFSDSVAAGLLAGAATMETVSSLWSSLVAPDKGPEKTIRLNGAPHYIAPELQSKVVAFPNSGIKDEDADYTLLSRLGAGGMGVVFEARQNHLNRIVALKMIRPAHAGDPLAQACFFYEAVITAGLNHPGIIPVLEFGKTEEGRDFYVMNKATGVPWSTVIRDKTVDDNLAIFDEVIEVVAYAHLRGILHRDIKPANILLSESGHVYLGDWGLAIAAGTDGTYGHAPNGGTPHYMAPEMARGDTASLCVQSDIYLLGGLLLEIVSGVPPHPAATPLDALQKAAENRLAAIPDSHCLMPVIRRCLEEQPEDRFATVNDLRGAIDNCLKAEECRTHVKAGRSLFHQAVKEGDYVIFQKSIAEFDNALLACPDDRPARHHRLQSILAYSRTALANREYDLARSTIKAEIPVSNEAAVLAGTISDQEKRAARKARRARFVTIGIVVLIPFILGAGTYVYITNRPGIDNLLDGVTNYDQRMRRGRSNSIYTGLWNEFRVLQTTLYTYHSSHGRGNPEFDNTIAELMGITNRCGEEFRFPDSSDESRKDAACRFLLERQPRLNELFTRLVVICETDCKGSHPMLPDFKRQYARLTEFLDEYAEKGL